MAAGDLNGDGFDDLVVRGAADTDGVVDAADYVVWRKLKQGGDTWGGWSRLPGRGWSDVRVADVTEDGRDDVLAFRGGAAYLIESAATPSGFLPPAATGVAGLSASVRTNVAVGDVNGDGHLDVISTRIFDDPFFFATGDGSGRFTEVTGLE